MPHSAQHRVTRTGRSGHAVAALFAVGALLALRPHPAVAACEPGATSRAIRDVRYRYQERIRGTLCDGFVSQLQAGPAISVVSFLADATPIPIAPTDTIQLRCDVPQQLGSQTLRFRGVSLDPYVHYQLDAECSARQALNWPLGVVGWPQAHITHTGRIGFLAQTTTAGAAPLFLPIRMISAHHPANTPAASHAYTLQVYSSGHVDALTLTQEREGSVPLRKTVRDIMGRRTVSFPIASTRGRPAQVVLTGLINGEDIVPVQLSVSTP